VHLELQLGKRLTRYCVSGDGQPGGYWRWGEARGARQEANGGRGKCKWAKNAGVASYYRFVYLIMILRPTIARFSPPEPNR
jgi:hypothetical protein